MRVNVMVEKKWVNLHTIGEELEKLVIREKKEGKKIFFLGIEED